VGAGRHRVVQLLKFIYPLLLWGRVETRRVLRLRMNPALRHSGWLRGTAFGVIRCERPLPTRRCRVLLWPICSRSAQNDRGRSSCRLRRLLSHLPLHSLHSATAAATLRMPLPALRRLLMASSTFGDTLGRPSFFPCWRTRSRPAKDPAANDLPLRLAEHRRHWIMARPLGAVLSMACWSE
jgi:hypothetical protein